MFDAVNCSRHPRTPTQNGNLVVYSAPAVSQVAQDASADGSAIFEASRDPLGRVDYLGLGVFF